VDRSDQDTGVTAGIPSHDAESLLVRIGKGSSPSSHDLLGDKEASCLGRGGDGTLGSRRTGRNDRRNDGERGGEGAGGRWRLIPESQLSEKGTPDMASRSKMRQAARASVLR